ncbi:hypothetical protein BSKO_03516 [Bryopsis sp. KO-2023]|nr:hypothetical protein BSKO_03516 [Bryopsis sp. KO-2023]
MSFVSAQHFKGTSLGRGSRLTHRVHVQRLSSSLGACTQSGLRQTSPRFIPDRAIVSGRFRVAAAAAETSPETDFRKREPKDVKALVVGSTGYIGKFVVKELVNRGYDVTAFAREKSGVKGATSQDDLVKEFPGVNFMFGDVTSVDSIKSVGPVDVVISCLASRTGGKKDSWLIDYQATKNALDAGQELGAKHFVLLSAICVQKPLLEFQRAKLKFEADLQEQEDVTWSIVRPTAFFKSLAGQIELVKKGNPYVMFGDGTLAACKPISESDLAAFIVNCVTEEDKVNQVLPIGGPGKAYTALEQAKMQFKFAEKDPKYIKVPVAIMDAIISVFKFLEQFFPGLEDPTEFASIGRYYATESMLVYDAEKGEYDADATPSFGEDTLEAFFEKAIKEGLEGQELGDQAIFGD